MLIYPYTPLCPQDAVLARQRKFAIATHRWYCFRYCSASSFTDSGGMRWPIIYFWPIMCFDKQFSKVVQCAPYHIALMVPCKRWSYNAHVEISIKPRCHAITLSRCHTTIPVTFLHCHNSQVSPMSSREAKWLLRFHRFAQLIRFDLPVHAYAK